MENQEQMNWSELTLNWSTEHILSRAHLGTTYPILPTPILNLSAF